MADVITRLKVESSEYDSKIKRATQSLNEMTTAAEREGNKIATANKENIALAQSLGKMATVSTTARGKMSELSSAIEAATIQYNRLTAAEKQGQFGKALNASITQLQGRLKGLQGEMAAVQGQMGGLGKGGGGMGIAAQFGMGLKSAATMFGPAALAMGGVMAAVGGVKKVFGDMISINKEFEQSTANLASIMGKTTDEVSALTEQAKNLGATTRYTAIQITELQTNLARLGFTQQEILNSTAAVQALATATGADLGEAANLAGAALRGFGLNATEMERVASVLAVSTTKSALSFEKLATAVPIVAPVAKQFGFTIEDTVTLLGKLSDAGMDASTAATATRNIFLKMANESGKLATAMGRPVHSVEEFGEALKDMRENGMDLNDILNMVGVRSTAAFAVFADNAETLADFKESITDCSEALHDMETKQLNTLEGSITMLHSAWDGLMLSFDQSNGVIKDVVDGLTKLITIETKRMKWHGSTEEKISVFKNELSADEKKEAERSVAGMREAQNGRTGEKWYKSDEEIINALKGEKDYYKKKEDELRELLNQQKEYTELLSHASSKEDFKRIAELSNIIKSKGGIRKTSDLRDNIYKDIANAQKAQELRDYQISLITPPSESPEQNAEQEKDNNIKLLKAQYKEQEKAQIAALDRMALNESVYEAEVYKIKRETLQKIAELYQEETAERARANADISQLDIAYQGTQMRLANKEQKPQDRAQSKVDKALEDYATTMNLATIRMDASLDDEEKYKEKELSAHERLFDAYTEAYNIYADPKYKEAFDKEAAEILELARVVKELKDTKEAQEQADKELEQTEKERARQIKQIDSSILRGLTSTAKRAGWGSEQLGVAGMKTKINTGIDISEEEWTAIQNKLNERLQSLGLEPIRIDFETGNIETVVDEAKAEFERLMSDFSSGVGAVGDLVGAMDNLKSIGDDLTKVFSGEMDAWDALMTVFNSGVSIMQTVISVMEAINTLQQLSGALSDQKKEKQLEETTTVVAGKMAEQQANLQEAGTSMTSAGADAAESSAKAGKAVAGIPIVGPVLAVAAIAAVLAATFAAMSKAKSAGKFAQGGIVPGNSYSGDNLTASVNSGEVILNHAQSETVARQLTAGDNRGGWASSSFVTGENIVLGVNNFLGRSGQGEIVTTSMLRRAGINL